MTVIVFIHNLNVVISFLSSRHVIHVIKYYVNVKRSVAFNLHHCKLNIRKTSCFSGVVNRKYCAISHALFACRHVLVFCLLFCIYILLTHNVVPLVLYWPLKLSFWYVTNFSKGVKRNMLTYQVWLNKGAWNFLKSWNETRMILMNMFVFWERLKRINLRYYRRCYILVFPTTFSEIK